MNIIKKFLNIRESTLIIINILFVVILLILFKNFSTKSNVLGLIYYISIYAIIAGAMTVLIISGGFDLSAGVMLGFAGILVGKFIVNYSFPIFVSIILSILICSIIGTINGYIIAYINIDPFFVTLSTCFIIGSVIYIISGGKDIVGFPQKFSLLAGYKIFDIPILFMVSLAALIIFHILLSRNIYFRQNYAIGSSESGARLVGIKIRKVKMFNYTIMSTMAAIAGILLASRTMGSYRNAGADAAFQIITAVIIGGASLKGGRGSVGGTSLGLILMTLVNSAIVFLNLHPMWGKVTIGLFLILVVIVDENVRKERTLKLRHNNYIRSF